MIGPAFLLNVAVLAGLLFCLMISKASRRAMPWGALWGIAFGFWIVARPLLRAHHFEPANWRQWAGLDASLALAFGAVGAVIGFVVCLPLAPWKPRRFLAAIVATLLPAAYFASSAVLEWSLVSHPPDSAAYTPFIPAVAALSAAACVLTCLAVWILERRALKPDAWLRVGIALVALAGMAALPRRLPAITPHAIVTEAIRPREGRETPRPLLLVGLDSATWKVLRPLIDQGRLPVIADLVRRGVHGNMYAMWPPYWSAPAWGAILTGHSQEEIGVYEDLTASFFGGPSFELPAVLNPELDPIYALEFLLMKLRIMRTALHPRDTLHATPIWELLSSAGVKVGVVCLPFTYPAQGQAAVVISRRIVADVWKLAGVTAGEAGKLVVPSTEAAKWREWFSAAHPIDPASLHTLLPRLDWPKPPDSVLDPVAQLQDSWNLTMRVFGATEEIIRTHQELQVVMSYIGSFDTVLHMFWQYRFPQDFPDDPPRREDVEALGGVIDRYAELVDAQIGRLLSQFATPPNVVIVSDHGHGPDRSSSLFRGFHERTGIFIAAGPDIPGRRDPLTVSYYDVVPTILDLEGFEIPKALAGVSHRDHE